MEKMCSQCHFARKIFLGRLCHLVVSRYTIGVVKENRQGHTRLAGFLAAPYDLSSIGTIGGGEGGGGETKTRATYDRAWEEGAAGGTQQKDIRDLNDLITDGSTN